MDFYGDPEAVRATLRRVVGHDRMVDARMHACLEYEAHSTELNRQADWILADELEPVWTEAAEQGTTVFVFPKADQLSMVGTLAERHPDVQLVVDHMAYPDGTTAPDAAPWTDFEALADQGITIVSHNIESVLKHADRIGVLFQGKFVDIKQPEETDLEELNELMTTGTVSSGRLDE
jgi:hypothetical protein